MVKSDWDVLVIGTGPAGAISSYYAAEAGANVLMVDKKSIVGVPVRCGEGLPGPVLDDFGIKHTKEIVSNKCRYLKLVPPKGKEMVVEPHLDVCILNRDRLEQHLVERSRRKGAELMLRTTAVEGERKGDALRTVTLVREGEDEPLTVSPRLVIAADGVESRVGRWVGIRTNLAPRDLGACAQYLVEHEDIDRDTVEFSFRKDLISDGYAWVFPKGKGRANIGVGVIPLKEGTAKDICQTFIRRRFGGGRKAALMVGCVPSSRPVKRSVKGNVMLVGDAARQVMALTGAGVANALIAGRIAGKVAGAVGTGRKGLDHLEAYEREWRAALEKKLIKSYDYRRRVTSGEKKLLRFFRMVRFGMALYRIAPGLATRRMFQDFIYKASATEEIP